MANELKALPGDPVEAEIDDIIAEFDGDPRKAIRALLHDIGVLAADAEASTSRGYVRGKVIRLKARRDAPQR